MNPSDRSSGHNARDIAEGRIEYWRPDPALARYVTGYHRYVVAPPAEGTHQDIFFPGWTNLRFSFEAPAWSVKLGRRRYDPVPDDALFGPSSHVGYAASAGGRMIGAGLTPMGWARLIGGDASHVADRILVAGEVMPGVAELRRELAERADPSAVFDAWIGARLAQRPAEDPRIALAFERINDPAITTAAALADAVDLDGRALARLTRRHFGFTPKLLLRRARFLRALVIVDREERGRWSEAARHAGYFDGSHFLRDCHLFLGMPIGAFVALAKPLNRTSAQLRATVLGAPAQSLASGHGAAVALPEADERPQPTDLPPHPIEQPAAERGGGDQHAER